MSPTKTVERKLTTTDRCDRCGAQAYIRAILPTLNVLLFCAHHGRANEPALRPQTISWYDESELLQEVLNVPEP